MLADASLPTEHGAGFLAIDPRCIAPEGRFLSRVDALIDEIHSVPKAEGSERIYVPCEREWDNYKRSMNEGIPLPADVSESLKGAAKLSNLDISSYLK